MQCPQCATENPGHHRFCGQCGSSLSARCSTCEADLAPGVRFCGHCGTRVPAVEGLVSGDGPGAPARRSGAERRHVSVLFVDLVGFTSLSEHRDPEDVRELQSAYFEQARTIVARYGGALEKFIGDAVMAVWGTPVAQEDDAERAVRAALDLVDAVAVLGEGQGRDAMRARAGVVTGQAAVRLDAVSEGMVTGDVVNTAARVQGLARPGTVLVDDATREASSRSVSYAAAGEHNLKGRVEPLRLYTAVQVVAGGRGAQRFDGLEPPFTGRERELRLVKELFHDTVEHSRARLVVVAGAAGVGKSRLGWEFFKYIDGIAQMTLWHVGRCLSYGEGVAYWALAEMVRMRFRIAEGDPEAAAVAKMDAGLAEAVPDGEERAWVRPRLAVLLGLSDALDGGTVDIERDSLFAGWRLFLERLAEADPVVLLFEDMQFADAGLLDFVEHLLEWCEGLPIFMLVLARPELHDARPSLAANHRSVTALYLDPLPDEVIGRVVDGLVQGLPEQTRHALAVRSEGIPLFAIETVRMLVDRDLVVPRDGVYVLAADVGDLADLDVPPTLQALVAARLDNLPEDERRLVKDASVLGHAFTPDALRQLVGVVGGVAVESVDDLLASLARREVLTLRGDARSPEAGQYRFVQKVMRSVAYDTLSRRDRKARHLAAAGLLESGDDTDDIAGVIATHWLSAAEAVPDDADADELRATAVRHLERAGDRARGLAAPEEAHRYYERALAMASRDEDRARLAEQAGTMARRAGAYEVGRALLERAHDLWEGLGVEDGLARSAARLGDLLCELGRYEEGLELMTRVHGRIDTDRLDADVVELANSIATAMFTQGDAEGAAPWLEQVITTAEAVGAWDVLGRALNVKGLLVYGQGRPIEGAGMLRTALDLARRHDLSYRVAIQSGNLALLAMYRDLPEALALAEDARLHARRSGDHTADTFVLEVLSLVRLHMGRWDEIDIDELQRHVRTAPMATRASLAMPMTALAAWRGDEDPLATVELDLGAEVADLQVRAAVEAVLALRALAVQDPEATLAHADLAVELGTQLGFETDEFLITFPTAVGAALELGRFDDADRLLALVLDRPPGLVSPLMGALTQWLQGRAMLARGRGDDAEVLLSRAVRGLREHQAGFWLALALVDRAESGRRAGRSVDVELDEAVAALEAMGARPLLERARRMRASRQPATADLAEPLAT